MHFSFEQQEGQVLQDMGNMVYASNGILKDRGSGGFPRYVKGAMGKGLIFQQRGSGVEVPITTPLKTLGRTVAFWVRIHENTHLHPMMEIVGLEEKKKNSWMVGVNGTLKYGALGAIKYRNRNNNYVIGTTNLKDGQWHHVAVVVYGAKESLMAEQTRLYVDGVLEAESGHDGEVVQLSQHVPNAKTLFMGNCKPRFEDGRHSFVGALDEVWVFDAPLYPHEILNLKHHNHPHGVRVPSSK
jgi:hypothetical protein